MLALLSEAAYVGLLTMIVGNIVGFMLKLSGVFTTDLPEVCKTWNDKYVMEISLFLTGFCVHLLCEAVGINKWYCKNGVACR